VPVGSGTSRPALLDGRQQAALRRLLLLFLPPEEVLTGAPPETGQLRLPFRWQVEVRQSGRSPPPGVEPDRAFGLRFESAPENRGRAFFFLEADRGRMPVTRRDSRR
jgi:hypothetical protein